MDLRNSFRSPACSIAIFPIQAHILFHLDCRYYCLQSHPSNHLSYDYEIGLSKTKIKPLITLSRTFSSGSRITYRIKPKLFIMDYKPSSYWASVCLLLYLILTHLTHYPPYPQCPHIGVCKTLNMAGYFMSTYFCFPSFLLPSCLSPPLSAPSGKKISSILSAQMSFLI